MVHYETALKLDSGSDEMALQADSGSDLGHAPRHYSSPSRWSGVEGPISAEIMQKNWPKHNQKTLDSKIVEGA